MVIEIKHGDGHLFLENPGSHLKYCNCAKAVAYRARKIKI